MKLPPKCKKIIKKKVQSATKIDVPCSLRRENTLPGHESSPSPLPLPPPTPDPACNQPEHSEVSFQSLNSLFFFFYFIFLFFFSSVRKSKILRVKCHLVIRFSKPNREFNTFRDGTEVKTTAEVDFFFLPPLLPSPTPTSTPHPPALVLLGEEMKVNSYCSNVK